MDLIDFIRARLDEQEHLARRAIDGPRNEFVSADEDVEPLLFDDEGVFILPSRVLADIESKRKILELHSPYDLDARDRHGPMIGCTECVHDDQPYPCTTLRFLARPYRRHPDFDPAWLED